MNSIGIFWLIIAFLFLIIELGNPGFFFFFSFFLGAIAAALASFFISSYIAQLFIFLGGTAIAFFIFRIWIYKRRSKFFEKQETNIDALKGKQAVVVKAIGPNKPGYVSLYGVLWLACSANNISIAENTLVKIVDMQGAHILVEISEEKK